MSWRLVRRGIVYVLLSIAAFVSVFPFYWMIVGATNKSALVVGGKVGFGDNLFANAAAFFRLVDAPQVFWNSTEIAVIATIGTLAVSSTAGYGFEIFGSRIRERLFAFLLMLLQHSVRRDHGAALLNDFARPSHQHVRRPHPADDCVDLHHFLLPPGDQSVPRRAARRRARRRFEGMADLPVHLRACDALHLRGGNDHRILLNWNNYLWPLIVLQTNENKTVTLVVSTLLSAYVPDYGATLFATVLATLPTLSIFFLLQRQFVAGLTGGVK